jgi:predicted ArsR family transcriptional regulator
MTVLRSEARAVLQWCLAQPGWWRTRDVSDDLGYSLNAARKQMLRLDELNLIERGALNGRTPLWRICDRDHARTVANEQPKQRNYRKTKPDKSIFSVWSQVNGSRDD